MTSGGVGRVRDGGFSRRGFLGGAATLLGAVGVGGLLDHPAFAADGSALSAQRQVTYRRLVEALGEQGRGGWRGPAAREASRRFERWYGSQPESARAQADFALDDLGAAWGSGRGNAADRHRDLLRWAGLTVPAAEGANPSETEARRRAAVAIAVGLAAIGVGRGTAAELEAPA